MATPDVERPWYIVSRWQEYDGEARANRLRVIGIAAFYLVHLANYHRWFGLPAIEGATERFHWLVTLLAVAWVFVAVATEVAIVRHVFPHAMKYATTAADILLLTLIAGVGDGLRSPLVVGYFLILAVVTLRFSLPLIRFATAVSAAAYVALIVYAERFATADKVAPRHVQMIFLTALLIVGVTLGAVVRSARRMAIELAARLEAENSVDDPALEQGVT